MKRKELLLRHFNPGRSSGDPLHSGLTSVGRKRRHHKLLAAYNPVLTSL